jgi:hypothetical protein
VLTLIFSGPGAAPPAWGPHLMPRRRRPRVNVVYLRRPATLIPMAGPAVPVASPPRRVSYRTSVPRPTAPRLIPGPPVVNDVVVPAGPRRLFARVPYPVRRQASAPVVNPPATIIVKNVRTVR